MFWIKGSCGDIIQQLLSANDQINTGFNFTNRPDGGVARKISKDWAEAFPHNILHPENPDDKNWGWLERIWSQSDCDKLLNFAKTKTVVIGTHDINQLHFLKQQLGSNITTVGIVYDQYMEKFVQKNFFLKVINYDQVTKDNYKKQNAKLYAKAEQFNQIGALALKDELKLKSKDFQSVDYQFDHSIDLGLLLNGNLQWFGDYVLPNYKQTFDQWISNQNPLFTNKVAASLTYNQCLGYNKSASNTLKHDVVLDVYDKIFISHYTKINNLPPCKATTHAELIDFFEKL
jgi:hypothetical protein